MDKKSIVDRLMPVALIVGALLTTTAFLLAFLVAPLVAGASVGDTEIIGGAAVSNKLLLSQKIFFFHVPVAIVSFGALVFTAYYSIRYLMTRDMRFDTRARIATEIALVFILATMASGDLTRRLDPTLLHCLGDSLACSMNSVNSASDKHIT